MTNTDDLVTHDAPADKRQLEYQRDIVDPRREFIRAAAVIICLVACAVCVVVALAVWAWGTP